MNSKYFEELINNEELARERKAMKSYGPRSRDHDRMQFEFPNWMSNDALKLFIRFLYIGRLDLRLDQDFKEMFDFYLTSYFFRHYLLEDYIVIECLIPQMTVDKAIQILK